MSSKSKRGNKPPRRSSDAHLNVQATGGGDPGPVAAGSEHHDPLEDYIEVPEGRSVWMQIFLIGLLILLLIIFIVPFAFMNTLSGEEELPQMVWEQPDVGTIELSYPEYIQEKRRFDFLLGGNSDDNAVAAAIIYDAVGEQAGIEISDNELLTEIERIVQGSFGGQADLYRQAMRNHPGGAPGFEDTFRRYLRGRRWGSLLGQLATVPDPVEIEELWADQHKEYRFEYVELAVEDVKEAARADVPEDELEEWFNAKQDWEKNRFMTPERYAAELAYYPAGTESPTELLARYPETEEVDAEQRAEDYYNRVFFSRFVRPEPAEGEPELGTDRYLPFDEVKDIALLEAPIFYAMQRWLDDVNARSAATGEDGEAIDLSAEAAELGLAFLGQDEALDGEGWTGLENLGGVRLSSSMRRTPVGTWIVGVTAESGALIVGRVTDKVEATLPPFAEIRDQVVDAWVDERAADLAQEKLAELRSAVIALSSTAAAEGDDADAESVSVDESTFRTAAEVAGYTVMTRDWLDRAAPTTADPDASEPAHLFIRGRADLYTMDEGMLSEAVLDGRREHAYLVRQAGARDVSVDKMKPQDYASLSMRSSTNARIAFGTALFSAEELERVYGLRWPRVEQFDSEASGELSVDDGEEDIDFTEGE